MNLQGEKISIAGAGLTGSLLALFLARRGAKVTLYERRPDLRKAKLKAGRSINLALSERGLNALRALNLETEVKKITIPMRRRVMHDRQGKLTYQDYGRHRDEHLNSVDRGGLNKLLLDQTEKSPNITLHFEKNILNYDLKQNTIHIKDETTGNTLTQQCGRLIATDGASSRLRDHFLERVQGKLSEQTIEHGYKELTLPSHNGDYAFELEAMHYWSRKSFVLIAIPNPIGSFTLTLFYPLSEFEKIQTPEQLQQFFQTEFPDLYPLLPELTENYFSNPVGKLATGTCTPWQEQGKFLLLGDAAHWVVPFFGQGMNSCFEDCFLLDQALAAFPQKSWEDIFSDFTRNRKKDTDAIATMALEHYEEMRADVIDKDFQAIKEFEQKLMQEYPDEYISKYVQVSFTNTPYSEALKAGIKQASLLKKYSSQQSLEKFMSEYSKL